MNEPDLRTDRAHGARIYDYILGGKDNYAMDRQAGDASMREWPALRTHMQANRAFMHRVGRFLAAERCISQFLDIGTGIPTEPNLHQIAQGAAPDARVVYVDNDPIVLAHAEALLRGTPQGTTEYIQADAREPAVILEQAGRVLDFGQPVALSLIALMHFIADEDGAYDLVGTLVDVLAPGSYLVLSAMTADFEPEDVRRGIEMYAAGGVTLVGRSHAEVGRFFKGLDLVEPGIVSVPDWHPELAEGETHLGDGPVSLYAGVARK